VLDGRERSLGSEHSSTLDTVNDLDAVYQQQGKVKEAEAMFQRALVGKEMALGWLIAQRSIPCAY